MTQKTQDKQETSIEFFKRIREKSIANNGEPILTSIELREGYKCFKKGFRWDNIPKFTILTGINGSGKTQLLRMLNGGHDTVDKLAEIASLLPNLSAWNRNKMTGGKVYEFLPEDWDNKNCEINCDADFAINDIYCDGFAMKDISSCCKESRVDKRRELRKGAYFKGVAGDDNACNNYDASWKCWCEIIKKHGFHSAFFSERSKIHESKAVNNFLKAIKKYKPNMTPHWGFGEEPDFYPLKLGDKDVTQDWLSDGEREVLFLITGLFNAKFSYNSIGINLLLLDEPDAHLNPELAEFLINLLIDVVVKELGIQVIMTTHSASTVAFAGKAIKNDKQLLHIINQTHKM